MDRKFCDQCRKQIMVGDVYYYTIITNTPRPNGLLGPPKPLDLCSWSCVQDKAEEERM